MLALILTNDPSRQPRPRLLKPFRRDVDGYRKPLASMKNYQDTFPPSQELEFTGRFAGGLREDLRRKLPAYTRDFKDGLNSKTFGSTLFLYFAALANAIAFGALTGVVTDNQIGIVEMIVVTAVGGILFALTSGQPLTILGGTGPIAIFTGLLYSVCARWDISFLATYAWVGIWSGLLLIILALTDASALMKYFTRFTDEIFAALISVIFIYEALHDSLTAFDPGSEGQARGIATVAFMMGTYLVARSLKSFERTPYLRRTAREYLSDFGPTITIVIFTLLSLRFSELGLSRPAVPETLGTTTGRPWMVDLMAVSPIIIFGSLLVAILVTILLFLDQNITTRLVNSSDHKLRKGGGYHLDLLVVGIIVLVASFFALPWVVAATVHSLNHVRSLADFKVVDLGGQRKEVITYVRENRLSGLFIHVLIAVSLLFLSYIAMVPMAVLFGLFLFMGISSLSGNQFFDRMMLWITDPKLYPAHHYIERVPIHAIHRLTIIQLACFVALWLLKTSSLGILFPLLIAALVPIRMFSARFFEPADFELLIAEEWDEEHEEHPEDKYAGY